MISSIMLLLCHQGPSLPPNKASRRCALASGPRPLSLRGGERCQEVDGVKGSSGAACSPKAELRSACEHQLVLLEKLSRRKHKLEKSLRWTRKWRKASNVIYRMFFIGVLACSVVLIALSAPPAASTATTVTSSGMQSVVKPWLDSLWDGREGILEAKMEVVAKMKQNGNLVHEFASIWSLLEVVNVDVGAMLEGIDFVLYWEEEEEVVSVLKTFETGYIKNKIGAVEKRIDELDEKLSRCIFKVRKVAAEFLDIITEEIK